MTIRWSRPALVDLRHIRGYIAQDSPTRAATVVRRLRAAALGLEQFPRRGRPGDHEGTRELVVARMPYIVVYRIDDDEIVILRVLHGAQRWPPAP
jgi:addiction module RelE/StbE family toxin